MLFNIATLNSSLIWNIISFILPRNEYAGNWAESLEEEKHRQLRMFVILQKAKETGILIDKPKREAISTSIRENIMEKLWRRILYEDFYMAQYKVQMVQELKPADFFSFR